MTGDGGQLVTFPDLTVYLAPDEIKHADLPDLGRHALAKISLDARKPKVARTRLAENLTTQPCPPPWPEPIQRDRERKVRTALPGQPSAGSVSTPRHPFTRTGPSGARHYDPGVKAAQTRPPVYSSHLPRLRIQTRP